MIKNLLTQRKFLFAFAVIIILGAFTTFIHYSQKNFDLFGIFQLNINLVLMNPLVASGLLIRFLKWHILLRASGLRVKLRRSLAIFFSAFFVNLFFPLLIGDLATKIYFLKREVNCHAGKTLGILLLDKFIDLVSITTFRLLFWLLLGSKAAGLYILPSNMLVVSAYAIFVAFIVLLILSLNNKIFIKVAICCVVASVGWLSVYLIYFGLPAAARNSVSFTHFGYIFSNYVTFYPLTPMGIFIAANHLYIALEKSIADPLLLWQTSISLRIVSVLPAFLFGGFALLLLLKKQNVFHFDAIADEYTDMIPAHIRERLIKRKCSLIIDDLQHREPYHKRLLGLDLGGGKGWYASKILDDIDAAIVLLDMSYNQVRDAVLRDPRILPVVGDMQHLPFKDNSFDFCYSINAFHHLQDEHTQNVVFCALGDILKEKCCFYLHEINVYNVFFRVYMNYVFPLIKKIDEGIECWIDPRRTTVGPFVSNRIYYFTFLPDFINYFFMKLLLPIENRLEHSRFSKYSAHYCRVFENTKGNPE